MTVLIAKTATDGGLNCLSNLTDEKDGVVS
jgi:hypothetical protein